MKQAVQEQERPGLYGPSQFLGRPKAKFTVRAVDPDNQPFPGLYNAGKAGLFLGMDVQRWRKQCRSFMHRPDCHRGYPRKENRLASLNFLIFEPFGSPDSEARRLKVKPSKEDV
jgi:hypothetical protein